MFDLENIYTIIADEPSFRKQQVDKLIFKDLIDDWNLATTLPLVLREQLNKEAPLQIDSQDSISNDNKTIKTLLTLEDGLKIEAVLMRYEDRNTICVSSQVGCPLGCLFCATGGMGFKRNLNVSEIIAQVIYFARILKSENQKITNVVYMGMGEPFLNYDNVLESIRILNDKEKFGLGARKISISTCGIIEGIEKFSEEPLELNLAISLHAANNQLRSELMPINEKYSLNKVLYSVNEYIKKTNRKVMFEYVLIGDTNDTQKDAEELAKLMKHPLYHLNFIQYNPTGEFNSPPKERIDNFKRILQANGISYTERFRFGAEIEAACGQLAGK